MSDNIALEPLRATWPDQGETKADLIGIRKRLGLLEGQYSSISRRVDRIGGDVEHIKRRLDLVDAPTGQGCSTLTPM